MVAANSCRIRIVVAESNGDIEHIATGATEPVPEIGRLVVTQHQAAGIGNVLSRLPAIEAITVFEGDGEPPEIGDELSLPASLLGSE